MNAKKFKFPMRQLRNTVLASCLALFTLNAGAQITPVASGIATTNTSNNNFVASSVSPTGDFIAAWKIGDNLTVAKWTGSTWSANTISSSTAIGSGWNFSDDVDVKVGTDGIYHVVIRAIDNNTACCTQERGVWYATFNPTNSTWSTFSKVQSVPGSPHGVDNPSLALDASNNPEIVYEYSFGSTPRVKEFRHAVKNGSSWTINTFATTSGDGSGDVSSPRIVVDGSGHRTISYMSNTTQATDEDFLLSYSDVSGSWVKDTIAPAVTGSNFGDPNDIALYMGFMPVVAFSYEMNNVYGVALAAEDVTNVWTANPLADSLGVNGKPAIATNANGHIVVAYLKKNTSTSKNELWANYFNGSSFENQLIHADASSNMGSYLDVSLNDANQVMIIFHNQVSSAQRDVRYYIGTLPGGSSSSNTAPTISDQGLSIDENSAATTAVGTVSASDDDNDPLTFSITAGNTGGAFAIDASTGAITVAGALDYETLDSYALTVQAHDGTDSTSATVTITINDLNEAVVEVLAAWDASNMNDYDFQESFPVTASTIENAGQLLTMTFDQGTTFTYNYFHDANGITYLHGNWGTAADSVSWLTQVNTTGYRDIKVSSKQRSGVNDNGPGEFKLQYSLDSLAWVDVVSNIIVANSEWTTGEVMEEPLPVACENQPAVYLRWLVKTSIAADGTPYSQYTYNAIDDIAVIGTFGVAANTAPVMTNASLSVDEDGTMMLLDSLMANAPGTFADADDDDPAQVRIDSLPTNGTIYRHGGYPAVKGDVYSLAQFSLMYYEPNADFNGNDWFILNASDGTDWAVNPATINITVNSVNDAPVLEDIVLVTEEETAALITDHATSTTYTDLENDPVSAFRMVTVPSNGWLTLFGDTLSAGAVVPAHQIEQVYYIPAGNYSGSDSFTFNATDGTDYAAANATVNITVNGINDAPTGLTASANAVNENSTIGTLVATLSAIDADLSDSHIFQLISGAGDTGNGFFSISGNQLLVASGINYELTAQLSVRVQAVDSAGSTFEQVLTIDVIDANDAPSAITLSNNSINEQQPSGSFVGSLTTSDEDVNDSHTLTLVSGAGDSGNGSFTLVNNVLTTVTALDYNTQQQYSVRVRSTDVGNEFTEEVFVINVTDINQAPSDIAITSTTIAENNAIGAFIGIFSATDADANDTHTFALVSGLGDDDNASFNLANGELTAAESFDFETRDSYSIRVQATDNGGATTEEVFTISITDGLDAPTAVTLTSNTINENETIGTLIGSFATVDVDQANGHTYSFATGTGDTDNGSFTINSGALFTASPVDFETQDSYSIRVRSTDASGAWTEQAFTVTVNDLNEAPTTVTVNVIGVDENSSVGTAVGNISAIDPDFNDVHTFTLVQGAGANDNSKFLIQANKLQVNAMLDYETQASYAVRIRATDNGGAFVEKNITVAITDVNEAPTALTLSATSIDENEAAGSSIGTFSISDQDGGDSHDFTLVSGAGDTDNGMFYISGNILVANASFNFEQQSSYSIRVAGTDLGGLKEEGTFTITINNVADAPVAADLFRTVYKNQNTRLSSREFSNGYTQEEGNAQHQIRIDALPTNGQLMFSNTPITVGQTILVAEFNNLSYLPNSNYLGTDAFKFSAYDGVLYSAEATYVLNVVNARIVGGVAGSSFNNGSIISLNPSSAGGPGVSREGGPTAIEELPLEVTTFGNFPNPFQGTTNISFELSGQMTVTLEVYDMLGRKVASLVNGEALNGKQVVQWNGGEANGQYIARLTATAANGTVIAKTISLAQAK